MNRLFTAPVLLITSLLAMSSILSGCTAVVGAGATVGVAAVQERGLKGRASDLKIEALVLEKFVKAGFKVAATIGAEVYEGRVLLTGASKDTKITDQAVKLTWQVDGVKEVLNEIQIGAESGISDIAQDSWITAQLKSKMTFDQEILSIFLSNMRIADQRIGDIKAQSAALFVGERRLTALLDKYGVGTISVGDEDLRVAFSCIEADHMEELINIIFQGVQDLS